VATSAGTGTLTFTDANNGTFAYMVGGVSQVKAITRQVFGTLPTCSGTQLNLALATNYQDLWWANPPRRNPAGGSTSTTKAIPSATWFTYDIDGSPLARGDGTEDCARCVHGRPVPDLVRGSTPSTRRRCAGQGRHSDLHLQRWQQRVVHVHVQVAGMAAPVTQTKAITRELFSTSGTTCQ
jgi:hypothetical protein